GDHVEHRLHVGGRFAYNLQIVGRGRLPFERFPGLVEQARVLQGDAHVCGDGGEQALIVSVVGTFRLRALHADHTKARAAHQDWHAQVRQRLPTDDVSVEIETVSIPLAVDDEGLARVDNSARQSVALLERHKVFAVLIREVDGAGALVAQRDVGDVGIEDRAYSLADHFQQGRELELAGELLRDGVDGGKLGGTLLRFGEQPRVLDGDRRLQRQPDQELQLAVQKRLASGTPDGHRPFYRFAGHERRDHQALALLSVCACD